MAAVSPHGSHPYDTTMYSTNSAFQVDCRGLLLLGYKASNGVIFCCVHQLAVELWKAFDTPRVSVQKKIGDLKIAIHHCDKAQIKMLRDAGIIHSFRATMIRYHDALRLYDALELSRRKRGLEKHALKFKLTPGQRAQRPEEIRARRLTTSTNIHNQNGNSSVPPVVNTIPSELVNVATHGLQNHKLQEDDGCSLIRTTTLEESDSNLSLGSCDGTDVVLSLDTLLTVNPPEKVGGRDCMVHQIQIIPLERFSNYQPMSELPEQRSIPLRHMAETQHFRDRESAINPAHRQGLHRPSTTDTPDIIICEPPDDPSLTEPSTVASNRKQTNRPSTSRLSSPMLDSSECDDYSSLCSHGSSHRSSSVAERFLQFDGSSDEEVTQESSSESESEVFDEEYIPPKSMRASVRPTSTVQPVSKKNFGTKLALRHFAHASSPNITASSFSLGKRLPRDSSSDVTSPSAPLVISVPFSMLKMKAEQPTKSFTATQTTTGKNKRGRLPKNRPTALSSFVTKKRASSRSSSTSSEKSTDPPPTSTCVMTTGKKTKMVVEDSTTNKSTVTTTITVAAPQTLSKKKDKTNSSVLVHKSSSSSLSGKTVAQVLGLTAHQSTTNSATYSGSQVSEKESQQGLNNQNVPDCNSQSQTSSMHSQSSDTVPRTATFNGGSSLNGNAPNNLDDDQLSVASSSTNSTQSGKAGATMPLVTVGQGIAKNTGAIYSDFSGLKTTINFKEMFSYFPPKLVVRDGELQPEHTLSVKNLDRQGIANLPPSHPFLSWTLGQPTRTTTKCPRKRKVGSSKPACGSTAI